MFGFHVFVHQDGSGVNFLFCYVSQRLVGLVFHIMFYEMNDCKEYDEKQQVNQRHVSLALIKTTMQ